MEEKLKKAKILIIDDDPAARALSGLALKKAGFINISDAENPVAGLNKVEWGNFDIILLDWMMPELRGIDVLRAVRKFQKDLPVIMVTSEDSREQVMEAMKAGVTDYVVKPWRPGELVAKVTTALENRQKSRMQADW